MKYKKNDQTFHQAERSYWEIDTIPCQHRYYSSVYQTGSRLSHCVQKYEDGAQHRYLMVRDNLDIYEMWHSIIIITIFITNVDTGVPKKKDIQFLSLKVLLECVPYRISLITRITYFINALYSSQETYIFDCIRWLP